jgi:hypothetical protein
MLMLQSLLGSSDFYRWRNAMPDNWIEISSKNGDHITYMMPAPGGALIRHIELGEDSAAVSVSICFVPNADGQAPLQPDQFPFAVHHFP